MEGKLVLRGLFRRHCEFLHHAREVVALELGGDATLVKAQSWAVSARYAAPGSRPGNRRHPPPDDFRRRTIVGPAAPATVEAVLDLLEVPEDVRVKIRANSVVQSFVEGKLVPDHPYPHHMTGGHYVNCNTSDEQFVEWSIDFAFVTQVIDQGTGGPLDDRDRSEGKR